jgi:IPT/TIG domain
MADNDPNPNEGPGDKLVPMGFIILFGVLLLAATGALLYGLYAACPTCEPPESAAGAAPTTATNTSQSSPSQSPGVTTSPTSQGSQTKQTQSRTSQSPRVTTSPTPVPELKLIAVAPNSGSVMGGNLVRLEGVGLNNVKEVRFGGQLATMVGLPNPTLLTVKPAAQIEGRVDVVVSDGQGNNTSANPAFYTYTCPPLPGKEVIWLMILTGALGGMMHALRSFSAYVGNRNLKWCWVYMYFSLPFLGAGTSTIFYLVIRGGLMSGSVGADNVFGLMAVGALVGLFSQMALLMLEKIAKVIFTETPPGKDPISEQAPKEKPPLKVEKVEPAEGLENQPVIILGSGFTQEVKVAFDDQLAKVAKVEDQAVTVTTPLHAPGKVKVVVIQGGASVEAPGGFTYKNAGPAPGNNP